MEIWKICFFCVCLLLVCAISFHDLFCIECVSVCWWCTILHTGNNIIFQHNRLNRRFFTAAVRDHSSNQQQKKPTKMLNMMYVIWDSFFPASCPFSRSNSYFSTCVLFFVRLQIWRNYNDKQSTAPNKCRKAANKFVVRVRARKKSERSGWKHTQIQPEQMPQ